jgi:hypothetical protein
MGLHPSYSPFATKKFVTQSNDCILFADEPSKSPLKNEKMKKLFTSTVILIFLSGIQLKAQVGISTDPFMNIDSSAIMDIQSNDKGMLTPRMNTYQRMLIDSPADGLIVYDADLKGFFFYDGINWTPIISERLLPKPSPQSISKTSFPGSLRAIDVEGNYAYLLNSSTNRKLQIVDISDVEDPVLAGELELVDSPSALKVLNGFAYIATMSDSAELKIVNVSDPANPVLTGTVRLRGQVLSMAVEGSYAYLGDSQFASLQVVDILDSSAPAFLTELPLNAYPVDMAVQGNHIYIASEGANQLQVIDINDPTSPIIVGSYPVNDPPRSVAVRNKEVFLGVIDYSVDYGKCLIIDINNPATPFLISEINLGSNPIAMEIYNVDLVILNKGNNKLEIAHRSGPFPDIIGELPLGTTPRTMAVQYNHAYILMGNILEIVRLNLFTQTIAKNEDGEYVNGPWNLDNSDLYTMNNYVGIGTTSPSRELEVVGQIKAESYIGDGSLLSGINVNDADSDPSNELQNWSNLPGIPTGFSDGVDHVADGDTSATNELQTWTNLPGIPSDFSDGIDHVADGDTSATNELQTWTNLPGIPGDIMDGDQVNDADSDPSNELQNWNNLPGIPSGFSDGIDHVADGDTSATNELQTWTNLPGIPGDIMDGDQVNDADSSPNNELISDVNLSNDSLKITEAGITTSVDLSSISKWEATGNDIQNTNSGKVYIGQSTTSAKLNLGGDAEFNHGSIGTIQWGIRIRNPQTTLIGGMRMTNNGFFEMTNNANIASPNFARLSTAGSWTTVSDIRLKKDVISASDLLSKALSLDPVRYHFKSMPDAQMELGLIAQEVQEILPELVEEGDFLTLNYSGLSVVAIGAIKEQQEMIKTLQQETAVLKAEIAALKKHIISTPK